VSRVRGVERKVKLKLKMKMELQARKHANLIYSDWVHVKSPH
jgi:hypothetical protein